jgi:hypothetical protein
MKEECDFYVGQNVWSIRCGWTKVKKIDRAICKLYDTKGNVYTLAGRASANDMYPILFSLDILNGTKPPCEFKCGDVVMVANAFEADCFRPVFFYKNHYDGYYCYIGVLPYTSYHYWKYCLSIEDYKELLKEKD